MDHWTVTRRDFLGVSTMVLAGLSADCRAGQDIRPVSLRFGMATDLHYADTDPKGTRFYRESTSKLAECIDLMNEQSVDFLIELGDFKDQKNPPSEADTLKNLDTIESVFRQFKGPRYHVIGNHDVDSISKAQFLSHVDNTGIAKGAGYYSFDAKGVHMVVLDANFNADGLDYGPGNFKWTETYIPRVELDWLERDLSVAAMPVIVFVHQQLDGERETCVRNAAQVRRILEESGKVLAVFQGHHHSGGLREIGGIHYYTLKAMVEGSGEEQSSYAVVEVNIDRSITVTGYRRATGTSATLAFP